MADALDRAREQQEALNTQALSDFRHRQPHTPSRIVCIDCGEIIPPRRRVAAPGCARCIDCQRDFEIIQKQWRQS